MKYRLSLILYTEKYGGSNATRKYKTIYRWKKRYDDSWDSLRDRSRRPYPHPSLRRRDLHTGLIIF